MPRNIGRIWIGLWLSMLIFAAVIIPRETSGGNSSSSAVWQYSAAPVVKLGVRNKEGRRTERFTAVCVVSAPDDKQYRAQTEVVGDNWGYVVFPDDFPTWAKPGPYTWQCLVDGKQVADGGFEFTGAWYSNVLKVSQP